MNNIYKSDDPKIYSGIVIKASSKIHEIITYAIMQEHRRQGYPWLFVSHGQILELLYFKNELNMSGISEYINRTGPTVTTLVRKLKANGFIDTRKDPEDHRNTLISLSKKGYDFVPNMLAFIEELKSGFFQGIDEKDIEICDNVLNRIYSNVMKSICNEENANVKKSV